MTENNKPLKREWKSHTMRLLDSDAFKDALFATGVAVVLKKHKTVLFAASAILMGASGIRKIRSR
ncbi:hypothetical protein J2128_001369 [Methanomicrobium sp. W14]|uniref:hypothetical protein n=1 Tax=Methanomicrobium sp. W14 TaxID=2817839 RepID=UPI001AE86A4C|nr:hypothetical protein [Methanomicrobium sp. W14]MBP2133415.1 hypothetical protein [Methanomicrobium sp. W14]